LNLCASLVGDRPIPRCLIAKRRWLEKRSKRMVRVNGMTDGTMISCDVVHTIGQLRRVFLPRPQIFNVFTSYKNDF
jgi:hypothetical protein